MFARSLDGGETWKTERHPPIAGFSGDNAGVKANPQKAPAPPPGSLDFGNPDFIMKLEEDKLFLSKNRGRDWEGPYQIPQFNAGPNLKYANKARTSYIVTGKDSCKIFAAANVSKRGMRPYVFQTEDGGKTFQFLSWIDEDMLDLKDGGGETKSGPNGFHSTMPAAIRLPDGRYICALRQRENGERWTDLYESTDDCRTWKRTALLEKGAQNPISFVMLKDGRAAAIYGNRREGSLGISAKISKDNGATWSREIMLRKDARSWDIGYVRAVPRPDGKIVIIYYYTTRRTPNNHIAATIWTP
jgi:hypothetical protein